MSFKRELKALKKRYPNIRSDISPTFEDLESGNTPGSQIPGVDYAVYKVRLPNSDARRGKSGGYRIIYYIKTPLKVLLVALYSKSDRSDIPVNEVKSLVEQAMKELESENS